jgi:NAD(P)-dependent dehydrogenase (short-subunit alcohol dehydrogenase family)
MTNNISSIRRPLTADHNDVALVMNAGTDAGSRRVRELLRYGYRVAVTGRHVTHLARAIQGHSATRVLAIAADPTDRSQITRLVNKVESEFGRRIVLVVRAHDDKATQSVHRN